MPDIREQTIAVLDGLIDRGTAFELPPAPEELTGCRDKLVENRYKVLVVGEAKRGKSSLVNGLLGRDLLPTDVDVATSQVFNVRHAEEESYGLRFEDGSRREIAPEELDRYGSQVVADAEGAPTLAETLRWIEVEVPAAFLPEGIALLDTPGLGALHAAHAQITHRFVPLADAVVFVLHSEAPVLRADLEFLHTILEVTADVFFVQTKIDVHPEGWNDVRERSEAILRDDLGERLTDTRIWPINSRSLRLAATSPAHAKALLEASRYPELAGALQAFLARVAGAARAAEAVIMADRHVVLGRDTLETRLARLSAESEEERTQIREFSQRRRREFEADWGERGRERRRLLDELREQSNLAKRAFRQKFQPSGEIAREHQARIEAVGSMEEADALGATLSADIAASAMKHWRQVCEVAVRRSGELLGPFLDASEALTLAPPEDAAPEARKGGYRGPAEGVYERIRSTYANAAPAGVAGALLLMVTTAPLAVAAAVGAVIWAGLTGWRSSGEKRRRNAQNELSRRLAEELRRIQQHFFDVDLGGGRPSPVDDWFATLEADVKARVGTIVTARLEQARAEYERARREATLNEQQRREQAREVRAQLAEWDELGGAVRALAESEEVAEALERWRRRQVTADEPALATVDG